jgi:hypothetical protein
MSIFNPEDGGDMFLRKVGWLSKDYTASYLTRYSFSRKECVLSACALACRFFFLSQYLGRLVCVCNSQRSPEIFLLRLQATKPGRGDVIQGKDTHSADSMRSETVMAVHICNLYTAAASSFCLENGRSKLLRNISMTAFQKIVSSLFVTFLSTQPISRSNICEHLL